MRVAFHFLTPFSDMVILLSSFSESLLLTSVLSQSQATSETQKHLLRPSAPPMLKWLARLELRPQIVLTGERLIQYGDHTEQGYPRMLNY